jgi:hypothetical protein
MICTQEARTPRGSLHGKCSMLRCPPTVILRVETHLGTLCDVDASVSGSPPFRASSSAAGSSEGLKETGAVLSVFFIKVTVSAVDGYCTLRLSVPPIPFQHGQVSCASWPRVWKPFGRGERGGCVSILGVPLASSLLILVASLLLISTGGTRCELHACTSTRTTVLRHLRRQSHMPDTTDTPLRFVSPVRRSCLI